MRTSGTINGKTPSNGAIRAGGSNVVSGLVWTDVQSMQICTASQPPSQ
jgi:hypothetical protein